MQDQILHLTHLHLTPLSVRVGVEGGATACRLFAKANCLLARQLQLRSGFYSPAL